MKETGVPVLVSTWVSGSWSTPRYYDSIDELMISIGSKNAGYGINGQKWEIEGSLIAPPSPIYQKVVYVWNDENDRLQIANSIEEAIQLML